MLIVALGAESGFLPAARRRLRTSVLGTRAVEDQDLADLLHRARNERFADFTGHPRTALAIVAQHPDLDELVTRQRDIDFMQHGRRQARFPDHDDRMEMVGPRAQRAPLRRREDSHNVEF